MGKTNGWRGGRYSKGQENKKKTNLLVSEPVTYIVTLLLFAFFSRHTIKWQGDVVCFFIRLSLRKYGYIDVP